MSDAKYDKKIVDGLVNKIKDDPENIENYRELTNIYIVNNEFDSALSIYNKMLEIFPNDVQALINSGSIYFYKKNFQKVIEDRKSTRLNSSHS